MQNFILFQISALAPKIAELVRGKHTKCVG